MREVLSQAPADWLAAGPVSITNPGSVLSTFNPGTLQVVRFIGPHRFYRAAGWDGKRGRMASAYGSWWADEQVLMAIGARITMFENWLPKELLKRAWPAQYRGASALCEDWNDMKEMFRLNLPAGQELIGLAGSAAPQPLRSPLDPKDRKTPMLKGGAEQVYFKRTPTLNTVNPLWVYEEQVF